MLLWVCGHAGPVAGSKLGVDRGPAVDGVVEHCWGGHKHPGLLDSFLGPQDSEAESLLGSQCERVSRALPTQDSPEAMPIRVLRLGLGSRGRKGGKAGAESRDWTINPPLSLT